MTQDLEEERIVVRGEARDGMINCQLNALHMARCCSIRLAETGHRHKYDLLSEYIERLALQMERGMETVVPFPARS